MNKILVIGGSGFLGRHIARALLAEGYAVRCMARTPSRVKDLAEAGCEMVQGDISDLASIERAVESVQGVYVSIHTLSPQHATTVDQGFMDVETKGLETIVTACRTHGVRRLIYVTSLGMAPDAPSDWLRERWKIEQFLLKSGLDVTILRPGQIVGVGGRGFDMMMTQARKSVAIVLGSGRQKWRNIALNDLVYYLLGVLNEPRAFGHTFDVGCDDILTTDQMQDVAAEVLGRQHPRKLHLPAPLLGAFAPLIERMTKLPKGSLKSFLDSMKVDCVGDPMLIRSILPRPPLPYRQAVERALAGSTQPLL